MPTYGQVVDNLAYAVHHCLGGDNEMKIRHIVNAIFGWLAILFTALIGFRVSRKWFTAILIALLMFFSPRFLGHSFNNLKDLPLATAMIMGLYYILIFLQDFPKVKKSTMVMLAVSIGFAIAVRIGGLLLIAYFGLFCALLFAKDYLLTSYKVTKLQKTNTVRAGLKPAPTNKQINRKGGFETRPNNKKTFWQMFKWGLLIVLGGYILAMLLWPYGLLSPIEHPKFVLTYMSKFAISIRQNFEGTMQWSNDLPWYYTSKFILLTIPVAVIIGMVLYPLLGGLKKDKWFETFVVAFAFIFPVFWITYTKANVYGGWRHSIFAYPPMVALAGLGYYALSEWLSKKIKKLSSNIINILVIAGLIGLLYSPIRHTFKNHPYEYVYFNEIAGGIKKAYGRYELDYYYHSTREATEWVIAHAEKSGLETGDKIIVSSWHAASVGYFLRNDTAKFQNNFIRWYERANHDWDYAIFVITGMSPEQIKNKHFPPENTVHTINVDGKPICFILKREDKSDLKGYQYKSENQIDSALYYFNKSLQSDAYNEVVLLHLIETYFQIGVLDSAKIYIDRVLDFLPSDASANFYLVHYHLANNNLDDALFVTKKMIKDNFKNAQAYRLACDIYLRKNDLYSAEKELLKLMDVDINTFFQNKSNDLLLNIYKAQGFDEGVAQRKMFKHLAESFRKSGNIELAEQYEAASRN
jgi:tetratricopeptide (TPR) repeat protein